MHSGRVPPAQASHAATTALSAPRPSATLSPGAVLLGCASLGPEGRSRPRCLVVGGGVGVRLCDMCSPSSVSLSRHWAFSVRAAVWNQRTPPCPSWPLLGVAMCVHWTGASHCWLCAQCQNLHDSEHLTWLIVNHIQDLISLSHEPPVQDFISAVHRNSAASGLFIQAIQSRCENLSTVSLPGAGLCAFSLPEEWSVGASGFSCCGVRARGVRDAEAPECWCTGFVAPLRVGSSRIRDRTRVPCADRWSPYP